ncbi:MAG: pyruvate, phosphate dikinase [Gemmatimonadales bacterium]|nr:pyruvate, phosphate dikinase [Gemmatimonadales bacterium]NIN11656.1 pyruvate, phosphate dikinase [Gemmatimonadales bacterium]NIN50262.1 pyruvate, phosphate dikinase [Gemmatimonadales bacterium]NIP07726.1 pyruvate, phosphate dikinase [Gemmatimonadales bacterium]NIQ99129.1 pyruvate, phosphate dikinase [Gemmatimonadales bacterium]
MADVYSFGSGKADGNAGMRDILGGKGADLAEMTNLGIPVPPGFTISARLCIAYVEQGELPASLRGEVAEAMARLESATGRRFGGGEKPLLVSVRSGAKISMPGMMDTILNLGLNDRTVRSLAAESQNPRFAYDSYRRFLQMYGNVVYGIKGLDDTGDPFEHALDQLKREREVERDIDLSASDLQSLAETFQGIVEQKTHHPFPEDPWDQLRDAIEAVFKSWNSRRAVDYRSVHRIPHDLGTAVNVMAMVFGNLGEDSGSGVAFTRDPSTGHARLYGEFLTNAQGEDVVAGIRDPEPISQMSTWMPGVHREFEGYCQTLERHYKDMQDVEFTIERGKLYMLQTRRGKRTALAAVRMAVDMVEEGLIDQRTALARVEPAQLDQLLHPTVDPAAELRVLTTGLPASPGAAVGKAVFDANRAAELATDGEAVILVRRETSPDDFHGMVAAQGILTSRGGMTSHAAVVARGMGKCCVAGARELEVDEASRQLQVNGTAVNEGDWLTLDGSTGRVILGKTKLVEPKPGGDFVKLMTWADEHRRLRVRTNADTPADAARAREFGAEGIGLCRTEHMFFEGDRIRSMREMILSETSDERRRALRTLLPMQRSDFVGIFRAMDGYPVTIRLLDPPLHEFLPREEDELRELAEAMNVPLDQLRRTVNALAESNPMLGHRGCRLGIAYPEITEMQARAIFEAACEASAGGAEVHVEVMVPLVAHVEELRQQAAIIRETADLVSAAREQPVDYLVGTMIEVPRACVTAEQIAEVAEFFSFGTNDLTQTTFGISRDDAGRFLPLYAESGVLPDDPFQTLDEDGVGALVEMAVSGGRKANPKLKIGICGEHGGDPRSVVFCHRAGLNYVSCSPFRVPIARLAAAQAALADA